MQLSIETIKNFIDPFHLRVARDLCAESAENVEYVRGIAEFLCDTTRGLTMEEKETLIEYLGAPLDIPAPVS